MLYNYCVHISAACGFAKNRALDLRDGAKDTMIDELKILLNEVSKMAPDQKGVFTTWCIITLIRDLAYYTVAGIVAWALGRRLIHAIMTAYRESKRAA